MIMLWEGKIVNLLVILGVSIALFGLMAAQAGMGSTATSSPLFWSRLCLTCDQSILPGHIASLDIDQQGYPHLVADVTNSITNTYSLTNFYQDTLGWHSQIIDDVSDYGSTLVFRLDLNDKEHVLYNESELYIKYAYRDQDGWHVQSIFSFADFGDLYTAQIIRVDSLVIDYAGHPHATVQAIINQDTTLVYYIYLTESGWQKEQVGEGDHGAVALDGSGNPHFAYVTRIWDGLVVVDHLLSYAYLDNLGWHTEEVAHQTGPRVTIAIDGNSFPHIVSGDYYFPLEYHHKDTSGWHRETLGGSIAQNPHILLDIEGNPYIGFNECCGHIAYAFWEQDEWRKGQIPNPYFYTGMGMAMDGEESIHFTFRETSTYDVIYLYPYTGPIYTLNMPFVVH
jgi:hypothetical protein